MIVPLHVGSKSGRGVAVLTPKEKISLFDHLDEIYVIRGNFLLESHMRISEAYHVADHPEYFRKDNGAIFLPEVKEIGKPRATLKNRAILLSPAGVEAVEKFFAPYGKKQQPVGLASYQSMEEVFKRAAKDADFDTQYITTKMFRKTFISWLMAAFPERGSQIQYSSGHNYATMQGHYVTYGFRKPDVSDMKIAVTRWGDV